MNRTCPLNQPSKVNNSLLSCLGIGEFKKEVRGEEVSGLFAIPYTNRPVWVCAGCTIMLKQKFCSQSYRHLWPSPGTYDFRLFTSSGISECRCGLNFLSFCGCLCLCYRSIKKELTGTVSHQVNKLFKGPFVLRCCTFSRKFFGLTIS